MDMNNGYAVGTDGTIIQTTDGGENWSVQQSGTTVSLNSIFFSDENNGWAVEGFIDAISPTGGWWWNTLDEPATILHTINGGATWDEQTSGIAIALHDVCFTDNSNGIIVGGQRRNNSIECVILKTTDGGENWITQYSEQNMMLNRVYFTDNNIGTAVGVFFDGVSIQCAILKTTNGGSEWNQQSVEISGVLNAVFFIDANNGLAVGTRMDTSAGLILKTTDGGNNWISQPTVTTSVLTGVFFTDDNSGTIVGGAPFDGDDVILRTTDGGNTWINQSYTSTNHFSEVCFVDAANGWVSGGNGTILHTTNGGVTFVEEEQIDEMPTEFLLSQNYPNPFNPSTKIKYSVPNSSQVVIKVFDILGNEIETLVSEEKPAGTYEITWYAENLPSGVYFYQLKAGTFIESKKMILMK